MTALIVYTVAAFGLAYIAGHSVITRYLRELLWEAGEVAPITRWLVMLVECPACLGFWLGLLAGALGFTPEPVSIRTAFAFALYTAGSNFLLGKLTGIMPSQSQPTLE